MACVDRHMGGLRGRVVPSGEFKSLLWGICSVFPLANHFALPGFESVFSISQDPLMCVHASLSQNGFHQESYG